MKSWVTYGILIWILNSGLLSAQEGINSFLENWVKTQPNQEIELSIEELQIKYQNINFGQNDINNEINWNDFFFLSTSELQSIFKYLRENGKQKNVLFLNRIKELSTEKAFYIQYKFLENNSTINQNFKESNQILSYAQINNLKTADLFKNRNKIWINSPKAKWFFQTEKDHVENNLTDFMSGGIQINKNGYQIYVGDFITQFGMGLSLFQGFQFTNVALINNQQNRIKIHTGSQENFFMRGLALDKKSSNGLHYYSFISHNKSDARLNDNKVSNLFLDGTHQTNSEILNRKIIDVTSFGFAINKQYKSLSNTLLFHHHQFSKPILSFNSNYDKQNSISNTISWITSRVVFHSETNLDQFLYVSNFSLAQVSLSKHYFFKSFFAFENQHFKSHFRQIPDLFSQPEQYLGYQLEYSSKPRSWNINFIKSWESNISFLAKTQTHFRGNIKFRLVNRNYFQVNYHFKRKEELSISKNEISKLERLQFRLTLGLRGKWSWQQVLQLKLNNENGLGLLNKFEYKSDPINVKIAALFFYQNSGALYFYESDVPGFGYIRGYFNNGFLWYVLLAYTKNKAKFYIKPRVITISGENNFGCSFGLNYGF